MNAKRLYRIAAGAFILFAAGHTFGFLRFRPPTAEGAAVREAMMKVHFQVGHATFSYGDFYVGFGLYVTAYLLFSACVAWHLGTMASDAPRSAGSLGWAFFCLQIASVVLSATYFSIAPTVLSVLVAGCLGGAALQLKNPQRTDTAAISG